MARKAKSGTRTKKSYTPKRTKKRIPMKEAKTNGTAETGTSPDYRANSEARHEAQRDYFDKLYALDAEIDKDKKKIESLTQTHLVPVRNDLRDMRKERRTKMKALVGITDIPSDVLDLTYNQYRYARKAHEDGDAGQIKLEHLQDAFAALHKGQTLDWVAALEAK